MFTPPRSGNSGSRVSVRPASSKDLSFALHRRLPPPATRRQNELQVKSSSCNKPEVVTDLLTEQSALWWK